MSRRRECGTHSACRNHLLQIPFILIVLSTIFIAFFVPFPAFGLPDDASSVIGRVRRAAGYDGLQGWENGLSVEGTGEYLRLPSIFRMYFSPTGGYRNEIVSDLTIIEGFDGKRGWMVDETGMPGHLELTALEQSQIMAWTCGGYWLSPECPLRKELKPWSEGDTVIVFSLSFPDGILTATMNIDPYSYLPERCQWATFGRENFIEFDRYADAGGFLFPLDTGFPGMVTFNRAFAEKHGLLDEQKLETFRAGGVGGSIKMLAGQLEWLKLGGHRWEKVSMSVAGESQGVLADEAIAGLVGTGLLGSFRVLIDYPNKRIALMEKE